MPTVSVVMPVHNGRRYLAEAINSILIQSFRDFELLIIDDASDDDTPEIIAQFAKNDSRIIYIRNDKNMGVADSLNRGIKIAKGKYIARMDADDISYPKRFEIQVKYLGNNPGVGVVGTWAKEIDENGKSIKSVRYQPRVNPQIIRENLYNKGCLLIHPTAMIRSELFNQIGFYRPSIKYAEDYDLWLRIVEVQDIAIIPLYLLYYRRYKNSVTFKYPIKMQLCAKFSRELSKIRRLGLNDTNLVEQFSKLIEKPESELLPFIDKSDLISIAFDFLKYGQIESAKKYIKMLKENDIKNPKYWLLKLLINKPIKFTIVFLHICLLLRLQIYKVLRSYRKE